MRCVTTTQNMFHYLKEVTLLKLDMTNTNRILILRNIIMVLYSNQLQDLLLLISCNKLQCCFWEPELQRPTAQYELNVRTWRTDTI
jgi:hypothetical protein